MGTRFERVVRLPHTLLIASVNHFYAAQFQNDASLTSPRILQGRQDGQDPWLAPAVAASASPSLRPAVCGEKVAAKRTDEGQRRGRKEF